MKFTLAILCLVGAGLAAPVNSGTIDADLEKRGGCTNSVGKDGTVIKRCAIPWTKNYGDYDELEKRGGCTNSVEEDGTVVKRCAIPWTKNYGDYDE